VASLSTTLIEKELERADDGLLARLLADLERDEIHQEPAALRMQGDRDER
jgi:hypothetical protein